MAIKIFTTERIQRELTEPQLAQLLEEFEHYLVTGDSSGYFGRDYPFERPPSAVDAGLEHLHVHPNFIKGLPVTPLTNNLKTWRIKGRAHDRRSDTFLIYCQGLRSPDNFMLIAFLKENAHKIVNSVTALGLLSDIAEAFRRKY